MSNDSNLKTLIEDLQKRVDFMEKHHDDFGSHRIH